eukprot:m.90894 g.90894  ORF g.90894 m.90894 type:complete len:73 (+) comp16479_c0_seq1:262-480(+)
MRTFAACPQYAAERLPPEYLTSPIVVIDVSFKGDAEIRFSSRKQPDYVATRCSKPEIMREFHLSISNASIKN